jgi:4-hydroxyphenylacetate 3-monooxygenase
LFRLAWDFVGSGLGARNVLYERFYLTSAARNRINHHLRQTDCSRAYALVESILMSADKGNARINTFAKMGVR